MTKRLSLSGGLLILGGLAMYFGSSIQELGLGQNQDPGPRALPLFLAGVLIAGGILEAVLGGRMWQSGIVEPALEETAETAAKPSIGNLALVLCALIVYVGALGLVGFSVSTLLFASGMMIWLGIRAWLAVGASVGLILVIQLLFQQLFRVQLPSGSLGLPF